MLKFGNVYPDSAFNKNITKNFTVDSGDLCQIQCFLQYDCKSYNLGPPSEQGKRVCELSSSLHVFHANHLAFRPGFTYHPSTVNRKAFCMYANSRRDNVSSKDILCFLKTSLAMILYNCLLLFATLIVFSVALWCPKVPCSFVPCHVVVLWYNVSYVSCRVVSCH